MPSTNTPDITEYVSTEGDVLDAIIFKIYGQGPDALGPVMDANPHIRAMPVHLPAATRITLPALPEPSPKRRIRLWD